VFGGDVEIYGDYGGSCFLILGREACSGGGKRDHYFKAQRGQDSDLMVDPGCSGGRFDDVQDLHEQRVVMLRLLMNAVKTIPQKGAAWRVQRYRRAGTGRQMRAGKIGDGLVKCASGPAKKLYAARNER